MYRKDLKEVWTASDGNEAWSNTREVQLSLNPRELAHMIRALRVLHGQVEIRDQISGHGSGGYQYPPGSTASLSHNPRGVPLIGEVERMLEDIQSPEDVKEEMNSEFKVAPAEI